jgi:hypothetical protein
LLQLTIYAIKTEKVFTKKQFTLNMTSTTISPRNKVFQVAAVKPELQFPEIEHELNNWKVGELARRKKENDDSPTSKLLLHAAAMNSSRRKSAAAAVGQKLFADKEKERKEMLLSFGAIDTIRLNRAPDQVEINHFVQLHLPESMQERQVTNFEVRRMMQRSKAKTKRNHNDTIEDKNENEEALTQQQNIGNINNNKRGILIQFKSPTELENAHASKSTSILTKLSSIDSNVLQRKGHELQQMIREASRSRSEQFPLPAISVEKRKLRRMLTKHQNEESTSPINDRRSLQKEDEERKLKRLEEQKSRDIQLWYHRLGMEPPKKQ